MYHHLKEVRVLIADLDIQSHEFVKEFINAKRYIIESAFTIKEIKQKLSQQQYHVLLLGDPLPDGKGWEHIEEIKTDHPYLQIWCMVEKLNLKAALEHKKQVFRITPKPIRQDDLNGIRKLLRNLDNHYYLMDEGSEIKKNHFGTVYPTLEESVIKKGKSRTPKAVVREWKLGDDDGCFIVYYRELVTDFPV